MHTIARIGSLGYDTAEATIKLRAKEVLDSAGITPDLYTGLTSTRKEGSMAELAFHDPRNLQKARLAVRAGSKSYIGDKFVWLDAKKEGSEFGIRTPICTSMLGMRALGRQNVNSRMQNILKCF